MTFGEKLKKLRSERNLTQEDVAEKIFVTRAAISKWETDKGYPGIDILRLLAQYFVVTVDELISDEDVNNKRREDDRRARKCYFSAVAFLIATAAFAIAAAAADIPLLLVGSGVFAVLYAIFGILSTPAYKRSARAFFRTRALLLIFLIALIAALGILQGV